MTVSAPPRPTLPHKRPIWLVALPVLAIVVLAAAFLLYRSRASGELAGGVFNDMPQAPNFSLVDQNGKTVTMQDLRGKVVALSFLYTHCPDVCPIIASNLAVANRQLGSGAQNVEMVAVSVDPVGDTLPAVRKFTDDHGLGDNANWHYLMGSPAQLKPVWDAYHVGSSAGSDASQGVDHSALVYLIDKTGKLRVVLSANFAVSDLVQDVRQLASA